MFDVKLLPKSNCIALVRPTNVNNFTKCVTILLALMFGSICGINNMIDICCEYAKEYDIIVCIWGYGRIE